MTKVKLWGYRCDRCEHEWLPRDKERDPLVCPKCKSRYWNVPRGTIQRGRLRLVADGTGVMAVDRSMRTPND
jgi:DNA-directed RNA polymerase subunit RPC12/RpoP